MPKNKKSKLILRFCQISYILAVFFCSILILNITNQTKKVTLADSEKVLTETEIYNLEKYDSRDLNIVTSVKDQGSSSLCWAYSAISVAETSILKSNIDTNETKDNLSLSPTSIGYGRFNRPIDPLENCVGASGGDWLNRSGESDYAGILMSQWWGPISNSLPSNTNAYENTAYKFTNMIKIYDDSFYTADIRISEMKKAIAKYGAITFSYNNLREVEFYNPKKETGDNYYFHACTIIGWDDNISADKFVPSGTTLNGGWLVKNSYSSLPYFYLSYECTSSNIYAFEFAKNNEYDYNYFYDDSLNGGMTEDLKTQYVANIFKAKKESDTQSEYLKAVNVAFACPNTTVTVDIYTNLTDESDPESGTKQTSKSQFFTHSGYRTIALDNLVEIKKDCAYSIVVRLSSTSTSPYVGLTLGNSLSYRKVNGNYWSKINNNVLRIKGYSVLLDKQTEELIDINNANLTSITNPTYTGNEIQPSVTLTHNGKTLVENEDYTLTFSNNINASTSAKITIQGIGKFNGTKEEYFTIKKAEKPNISVLETIKNTQNANSLREITLPEGYMWTNENQTLEVGVNNIEVTYIGTDKDNFNTTNFVIQLTYVQQETENPDIDSPTNPPSEDNENDNPPSDENQDNIPTDENKNENKEKLSAQNKSNTTKIVLIILISSVGSSIVLIWVIAKIKKF